MRLASDKARELFAGGRVARLATLGPDGAPQLVPLVFALDVDTIYSAVDAKPKRRAALQRLANVRADQRVCLLVDEYVDDDWTRLWWARAEGLGRVLAAGAPEARRASELLTARYDQYRDAPPDGEVLAIAVRRWSGWAAAG